MLHPYDFYHEGLNRYFDDMQLEVEITAPDGQPYVTVVGVYDLDSTINWLNSPSPAVKHTGWDIAMAAEGDESWCDKVLAKEGWYFTGRNSLDPSGRWKVAS